MGLCVVGLKWKVVSESEHLAFQDLKGVSTSSQVAATLPALF